MCLCVCTMQKENVEITSHQPQPLLRKKGRRLLHHKDGPGQGRVEGRRDAGAGAHHGGLHVVAQRLAAQLLLDGAAEGPQAFEARRQAAAAHHHAHDGTNVHHGTWKMFISNPQLLVD